MVNLCGGVKDMDPSNQDRELKKKKNSKGTVGIHGNISKATKDEMLYLTWIWYKFINWQFYSFSLKYFHAIFDVSFYLKENNENKMNILYFLTNYYDEFFVI